MLRLKNVKTYKKYLRQSQLTVADNDDGFSSLVNFELQKLQTSASSAEKSNLQAVLNLPGIDSMPDIANFLGDLAQNYIQPTSPCSARKPTSARKSPPTIKEKKNLELSSEGQDDENNMDFSLRYAQESEDDENNEEPFTLDEEKEEILSESQKRVSNNDRPLLISSYSIAIGNQTLVKTLPLDCFEGPPNSLVLRNCSILLVEQFFINLILMVEEELIIRGYPKEALFQKLLDIDLPSPKIVIYFHSGGRFDGYFLTNVLFNSEILENHFHLKKNLKVKNFNGIFYSLKFYNLSILDSFLMTQSSLNNLGLKLFNEEKLELNTGENSYLSNQKIFQDRIQYDQFCKYNLKDSVLLLKCMLKIQTEFLRAEKIDISNFVSASSMGFAWLYMRFYKLENQLFAKRIVYKKIPSYWTCFESDQYVNLYNCNEAIFVTSPFLENQLRNSFFGGRTELFKPRITEECVNLDFNSLYPFAAKAPLPYGPPLYKKYKENEEFDLRELNQFCGFFKIDYLSPADPKLLPVLPRRHVKGHNIFSLGIGTGWFWIKEVLLAIKMGYKIQIIESIEFTPKAGMKKFVDTLYNERLRYPKEHPNNLMYKNLLVSTVWGKYASRLDTSSLDVITTPEKKQNPSLETQNQSFKPIKPMEFSKSKFQSTQKSLNAIQIAKTRLNKNAIVQKQPFNDLNSLRTLTSAVHIASAVTSQSRVTNYPFLEILYRKDLLFYTDTDSLF